MGGKKKEKKRTEKKMHKRSFLIVEFFSSFLVHLAIATTPPPPPDILSTKTLTNAFFVILAGMVLLPIFFSILSFFLEILALWLTSKILKFKKQDIFSAIVVILLWVGILIATVIFTIFIISFTKNEVIALPLFVLDLIIAVVAPILLIKRFYKTTFIQAVFTFILLVILYLALLFISVTIMFILIMLGFLGQGLSAM